MWTGDAVASRYWWVNQTQTFEAERDLGLLWAPLRRIDGRRVSHWDSLADVSAGDVVFHYAKQHIQGVSRVRTAAIQAQRPFETDSWPDAGRKIPVSFEVSETPVRLDEIDMLTRQAERHPNSPFQESGRVNQGYLFRLSDGAGAALLDLLERTSPGPDWRPASDEDAHVIERVGSRAKDSRPPYSERAWTAPSTDDLVLSSSRPRGELAYDTEQIVTREEFRLQVAFSRWLEANNTPPTDLTLGTGATAIKPDHYVKSLKWIVEAKKSEARPYVRLAIGQVLDYVAQAKTHNIEATPVILLPRRPIPDLVALLRTHGILLATPKGIDVVDFVVE